MNEIMTLPADETFWAWLAGFWDGDGTFQIARGTIRKGRQEGQTYYQLAGSIANTNLEVLQYIQQTLNAGRIYDRGKFRANPDVHKRPWKLQFGSAELRVITARMLPYLQVKRERAEIMLAFPARGGNRWHGMDQAAQEQQADCYRRLQTLNQRGTVAPHIITLPDSS